MGVEPTKACSTGTRRTIWLQSPFVEESHLWWRYFVARTPNQPLGALAEIRTLLSPIQAEGISSYASSANSANSVALVAIGVGVQIPAPLLDL